MFAAITLSTYTLCKLQNNSSNSSIFFSAHSDNTDSDGSEEEPKDVLKIIEHTDKSEGNKLTIIGSLKNTGQSTWDGISLQVELFNESKFVYECDEYFNELVSGQTESFIVSCGGCKDSIIPEYDNYTIRVVSAFKKN